MKSIIILLFLVPLCWTWSANWASETPGTASVLVKRLQQNFPSFWDKYQSTNEDTVSSATITPYIDIFSDTKGIYLKPFGSASPALSIPSTFTGVIQDVFWLPFDVIVFYTNNKEIGWRLKSETTFTRVQAADDITSFFPSANPEGIKLLVGLNNGQLAIYNLPSITPTVSSSGVQSPIRRILSTTINQKLNYVMLFGNLSLLIWDTVDYQLRALDSFLQEEVVQILLYKTQGRSYVVAADTIGNLALVNLAGTSEQDVQGKGKICKAILGSNSKYQDLLILGLCNGDVWTLNLDVLINSNSQSWEKILTGADNYLPFPVQDLAFNYLQTTPINGASIQQGEPVVIVYKNPSLLYIYNFATRQLDNLWSFSGTTNATQTANMIFLPNNTNLTDPNVQARANLTIGLEKSGLISRLINAYFLQATPAQAQSHYFTRRVYNKNASTPLLPYEFYGYYQKKEGRGWIALVRSILRFYRSQQAIPSLCEINNQFANPGTDCCKFYEDIRDLHWSFDNIDPSCHIDQTRGAYYIMAALDSNEISTIRSQGIPSFNRIQSEIINNNVVIVKLTDPNDSSFAHFVIVSGFQRATLQDRGNLDKLIIWDPSEESNFAGLNNLPYENLLTYRFSSERTLTAVETIYIRLD